LRQNCAQSGLPQKVTKFVQWFQSRTHMIPIRFKLSYDETLSYPNEEVMSTT
jgi:hypothetical protein